MQAVGVARLDSAVLEQQGIVPTLPLLFYFALGPHGWRPKDKARQSLGGVRKEGCGMTEMVNVRYMVSDVDAAVKWYRDHLDFKLLSSAAPAFADMARGSLRLLLSGQRSSAGRPMPDGAQPGPGGWNRIHLVVEDLAAEVQRLRSAGVQFRNDIVKGPGGSQVLIMDPSGNLVELFQPAAKR